MIHSIYRKPNTYGANVCWPPRLCKESQMYGCVRCIVRVQNVCHSRNIFTVKVRYDVSCRHSEYMHSYKYDRYMLGACRWVRIVSMDTLLLLLVLTRVSYVIHQPQPPPSTVSPMIQ